MSENNTAPAKKELSLKIKVLALVLTPLLIIAMCSVAIVITVKKLPAETSSDTGKQTEAVLYDLPDGTDEISQFVKELISVASNANDVKIDNGISVEISDVSADITEKQLSFANYLVPSYQSAFSDMYETKSCNYGEDASFVAAEDFEAMSGECSLNDDNTVIKTEIKVSDTSTLSAALRERDEKIISDAAALKNAECRVNSFEITDSGIEIYTESNIQRGKLTKLKITKTYKVQAQIEFSGNISGLGVQNFTFTYKVTDTKNFKYAGIFIKEESVSLDLNGYTTLSVSANTDENITADDYKLTFTSSAPEIVKADSNGMIEAVSEGKDVIITATLEYLGNVYTDTCTVSVGAEDEGGDNG